MGPAGRDLEWFSELLPLPTVLPTVQLDQQVEAAAPSSGPGGTEGRSWRRKLGPEPVTETLAEDSFLRRTGQSPGPTALRTWSPQAGPQPGPDVR